MSKVFEKISQELMVELYELKVKLKLAEEKNHEQQETIWKITDSCVMLEAENVFLKRQLSELSTPKVSRQQQQQSSSTPIKAAQDSNTSSSRSSDSAERWTVVEKPPRKLKYSQILGAGDSPESETVSDRLRLYVNHLSPSTDSKSLHDYFSKFGEVIDTFLRGPGFAFVTFRRFYGESPLMVQDHVIDGSHVELQEAKRTFRQDGKPSQTILVTPSVGKVSDEDLQNHFSKFGEIIDISRPVCGSNFAFVSFDSPECIDKAFVEEHVIKGVEMHVRRTREFDVNKKTAVKKQVKTTTILVSADTSIMKRLSVEELKSYFADFGKIVGVRKPTAKSETTHFAFVQFATADAVEKAMKVKYHTIKGQQVNVSKSHSM